MKYAWIDEHRDSSPVTVICRVLKVSRSGYYSSVDREPSARARRMAKIHQAIESVHARSHGIYGSAKITECMQQDEALESACRNTVATAMRQLGLKCRVRKAFMPTTIKNDPTKQPAANVLDRDFTVEAPNRKWVTDITYLPTAAGWVYLAAVVDLFSRKVVGWSIGTSLATELVSEALRAAIERRRPKGGQLLHHSDRSCQYTSTAYEQTLRTLGVECSMSRTGNCWDNAAMERFFWSLKHEWMNRESFDDLAAARLSVFKCIETFYNSVEFHQTLGYKSPGQYEAQKAPAIAG